jgi:hypothetical protein
MLYDWTKHYIKESQNANNYKWVAFLSGLHPSQDFPAMTSN